MAKYENIRALAKKQLQAVTESSDRWKAFLRTAAIAYNYSFPNQLLIHEQSPTATAVADIAYWNNNAGRWVKRGAHGIAVFDTRANSSRLRYLFDISDTIPRAEVPDALPWVITDQNWRPVWDKIVADNHADSIQSALLMLSTSCVAQRSAMFTTALGKAIDGSSLQWAKPDEQRQLFIDSSDSAYWAVQENINAIRAASGLSPLAMDGGLSAAADARCESFVAGGAFDHSGMTTRSEICAAGPIGSASSVCSYWQNSPAHYANITNASFTSMGVGCWFCSTAEGQYTYWTVTFN